MENVIARWEWRTFGHTFGVSEDKIRTYPGKVRESSEVYILSSQSMDNTKIRDMLMDIKYLVQVNENKLEQWNPLLKAGFPLSSDILRQTIKSWKVELPEHDIKEYSYDEFLDGLVKNHPKLKPVRVFKERHGFTINNCIVEIANLKFDNQPIRTIAVEQEDPVLVFETVRLLSLDGFENINYLKALKNFASMP
jgi:exopolyphosphatase/guanosine-5'-triphosphate,3'-diphosphate pyrophosphatase